MVLNIDRIVVVFRYHALFIDRIPHLQSGGSGSRMMVGCPRAPAKWATAVSTVITCLVVIMVRAVSKKSSNWLPASVIAGRPAAASLVGSWFAARV